MIDAGKLTCQINEQCKLPDGRVVSFYSVTRLVRKGQNSQCDVVRVSFRIPKGKILDESDLKVINKMVMWVAIRNHIKVKAVLHAPLKTYKSFEERNPTNGFYVLSYDVTNQDGSF